MSGKVAEMKFAAIVLKGQPRSRFIKQRSTAALAALVVVATISPLRADPSSQTTPPRDGIAFDVASVRPNKAGDRTINVNTYPGGRFVATNISVRSLVRLAYGLEDHEIIGGPSWMNSDPFDVEAIAGRELPEMSGPFGASGALPEMLKSLLANRFGLVARMEMREMPVSHLVMAREDRRLGKNLNRSTMDCAALFAQRKPGEGNPPCGTRMAPGIIVLEGAPISQLASLLAGVLRRTVIDRTNLEGNYDLQLHWQMRQPPSPDATPATTTEGPTLLDALQESAGLRLENAKAAQQVLVISSVERPAPN